MDDYEYSSLLIVVIISTGLIVAFAIGIVIIVIRHQNKMVQNKRNLMQLEEEYQKRLLQSSVNSQERERERIARDLHDEIGASLSAAKLTLGLGIKQNQLDSKTASKVSEILDHTISNVKTISKELLPVNLKKFGLGLAINDMCNEISTDVMYISFKCPKDLPRLDANIELGIYRICQELLSNAIQHAKATIIEVNLNWEKNVYTLEVIDNGIGIDNSTQANSKGLGMDNIHSRAQTINGTFNYHAPSNGKGTHARFSVPDSTKNVR